MKRIYELYKNYKVKYEDSEPVICGYTSSHLIGAINSGSLPYTFKKPKDGGFVDPEYTHISYVFCYVDESTILKQQRKESFEDYTETIDHTRVH